MIRVLNFKPMALEQLRMPAILNEMCRRDKGLILISGTTSQGKTTTLAAMIDFINRKRNKYIITIEDPVEYVHENKKSIILQRRSAGTPCRSRADSRLRCGRTRT